MDPASIPVLQPSIINHQIQKIIWSQSTKKVTDSPLENKGEQIQK